ncbi:hypothetical protein GCM10023213_35540 [Prosthecobacter algae]|uniref:Uncharacterized protein n=1 Tax=Prosthecobacter algae TaxID=1144682 RepID=A0ABP9PDE8_9BACT
MNDPSTGRPAAPFPLPPPSFLTPKAEKLLPKIEKAGVKAALKAGHVLSRDELLEVKVQLLPALYRWGLGGISAASAYGSYSGFMADSASRGLGMAALSLLFFFFAIVGVRRTLGRILESMDGVDAGELLGLALEGIGSVIGGLFDGV